MTLLKACSECGEPSDQARCQQHRPTDDKPTAQARGYDNAWNKLSARARRLQPFCSDCGATTDLQTDHSPEAWRRKAAGKPIRLADVTVVCGPCNRARGAARPGRVDPPDDRHDPRARQSSGMRTILNFGEDS